ncbi:hypothetical protein O9K51_08554 [Purpureocillium lavendulum]|uniref:Uncharacterized protein n=1 Tax=Purpureocillium lavendulum TaxID=1247861 RepID=A0AB34FKA9_9HYPO|nr:hypothetical protein O9K51_08554 [Purpureocillium lavendulum]
MLQVLNDESIFEDPTQCHFDFEEDGETEGESLLVLVSATSWVRDKLKHAVSKSAKRIKLKQLDYQIDEEPVDAHRVQDAISSKVSAYRYQTFQHNPRFKFDDEEKELAASNY